jgi:hypothetical protein
MKASRPPVNKATGHLKKADTMKKMFCLLRAGFFIGLLFDHEDGGDMFLQNVG